MSREKAVKKLGRIVGRGPEDSFRRAEARAMDELSRIHMDSQGQMLRFAMTSPFSSVRMEAVQSISDPKLIPALQFSRHPDVSRLGKQKAAALSSPATFRRRNVVRDEVEQAGMDQHKLLDIALTAKDEQTRVAAATGIFQPDLVPRLMASDCKAVRAIAQRKLAGRK